jgi:ATP-dependent Clp protease ATP-binding subunit ClpC
VAATLRSAKAGLKDPVKPLGVFLFIGSTGTGKTELAKSIAEFLFHDRNRMISFDMSEYSEKHTVSKLIGAPPGYIGYDEEGMLTSKIRTNPYCVLLFDEIEKAHPDVYDIFLQVFEEGRLTDSHGRKVSFCETIIILTSNLGCTIKEENKRSIGFGSENENSTKDRKQEYKEYEEQIKNALSEAMKPEFLNRIQKTVIFHPLDKQVVGRIIDKTVNNMNDNLKSRNIIIELKKSARQYLIDNGYSEKYGAREIQRTFDRCISERISNMILKGELTENDRIFVKDGERCWFIRLADIKYFESEGNYVRIHFENFKPLILKSLNSIDERLDPKAFFRANRSVIVNLKWIDSIEPSITGGLTAKIKNGEKIEISRRQALKFKETLSL